MLTTGRILRQLRLLQPLDDAEYVHLGQSEAMGELDNAEVSLVGLVGHINLINLGRIEEYATLSPSRPAILIIMFEGSGDNFGENECGTFSVPFLTATDLQAYRFKKVSTVSMT